MTQSTQFNYHRTSSNCVLYHVSSFKHYFIWTIGVLLHMWLIITLNFKSSIFTINESLELRADLHVCRVVCIFCKANSVHSFQMLGMWGQSDQLQSRVWSKWYWVLRQLHVSCLFTALLSDGGCGISHNKCTAAIPLANTVTLHAKQNLQILPMLLIVCSICLLIKQLKSIERFFKAAVLNWMPLPVTNKHSHECQ